MASYSYKLKENSDLCHFCLSSEKEYGVQSIILRHNKKTHHALLKNRSHRLVFMHVASPGKAFEVFEHEKYKIVIVADAYFKLLQFFHSDWPLVLKRVESDYLDMKTDVEWIGLKPSISFRGPADIIYRLPLDETSEFRLDLVVTRREDTGKTQISLVYTDATLGYLNLPPEPMMRLAEDHASLLSLCGYKETLCIKTSSQL